MFVIFSDSLFYTVIFYVCCMQFIPEIPFFYVGYMVISNEYSLKHRFMLACIQLTACRPCGKHPNKTACSMTNFVIIIVPVMAYFGGKEMKERKKWGAN